MAEPRVLVLRSAGTNCDRETAHAFERAGARADRVHVNRLLENPGTLDDYGMLVVAGGFSYGDDIAAGRVLGIELRSVFREATERLVARGGLVLGICNGFQVLVGSGLLPGVDQEGARLAASLTWNASHRYEDRWAWLDVDARRCVFAPKEAPRIHLPVAHAEGRFVVEDDGVLARLEAEHRVVFRYVDARGGAAAYPDNPNGSVSGIAGICDRSGQILGLMPHPERALEPWHHPAWTREPERTRGDGAGLFETAVRTLKGS